MRSGLVSVATYGGLVGMTNEELAEIEGRAEATTPGPWRDEVTEDGYLRVSVNPNDVNGICGFGDMEETDAADHFNSIFIAHARTDIPALVTEIKRLQAIEKAARSFLTANGPNRYPPYNELIKLLITTSPVEN